MALKTDYKDEVLSTSQPYRTYNIVDSGGSTLYSGVRINRADTPQQEGNKFGASDINDTNIQVNKNTDDIQKGNSKIENCEAQFNDYQKKSWTLLNSAGGATTGVTKTVANLSTFNEYMLVLIYQDKRVLVTTNIPTYDLIKMGNTDYTGGAHQAYYNGEIKGGITYLSNTSIKMYSNDSCIISLYAR